MYPKGFPWEARIWVGGASKRLSSRLLLGVTIKVDRSWMPRDLH